MCLDQVWSILSGQQLHCRQHRSSLIYSMADCNCSYLNMMYVIIACQDRYDTYDDGSHYLGICELQFNRTALLLTSDKPTTLVSSLNPPSCEAYMTNISCTVSLTSQPGQKVHVSIGNHYTLANHQCKGKYFILANHQCKGTYFIPANHLCKGKYLIGRIYGGCAVYFVRNSVIAECVCRLCWWILWSRVQVV